jgi:4-diphosphocytidyl-2-C-methyl-D-erythritol kinase
VSEEILTLLALAPAKVNLGLFLGPVRERDGRHELASVMQSISLADEVMLAPASAGAESDELSCPGVSGAPEENLAARALAEFREATGWDGPPVRLSILKRIPVGAGLAGGSADAAATLRLARAASGLGEDSTLMEIARGLGADVPAQLAPGRWLARGAGEVLSPLAPPRLPFGILVLPSGFELSTAEVYAEADRLGLPRSKKEIAERAEELGAALDHGSPLPVARELLHNDLQRAAAALRPEIVAALREAREAGGDPVLVSGSGPTVLGLFSRTGTEGLALARLAAARIGPRIPEALCAVPVEEAFGRPQEVDPRAPAAA